MTAEGLGGHLLILCQANVCRSVYTQALLSAALPSGIEVRSAGIRAATGSSPCPQVCQRCRSRTLAVPADAGRQCTVDDLATAGLVLVMTRNLQDAAGRLLLAARAKTFTLPAATAAAEEAARRGGVASSVSALADALHELRGTVPGPVPVGRRLFRRAPLADPWDIPDGHLGSRRDHAETLDLLQLHCDRLAAAWSELWPSDVSSG